MVVIDATPLQTGHRHHGIGSYTAGLLDALLGPSLIGSHRDALALLQATSSRRTSHALVGDGDVAGSVFEVRNGRARELMPSLHCW